MVHAQLISQTPLSPTDGWEIGNALASSGSTLVVGDQSWFRAPGHTTVGAAYVYTLSSGQWTQQARLTASDGQANDLFGCSVAIYGNTIVVGALLHNGTGAAYVFTLNDGQWTQQQELTAVDGQVGDGFGGAVGIAGSALAVGACHRGVGSAGAVYTYALVSKSWTQQAEITHDPTSTPDALFGFSLALTSNTMVIGAPGDAFGSGAAYVSTLKSGAWSPLTALTTDDEQSAGQFGYAVGVYNSTVAVGAPGISAAYLFTSSGGVWQQQAMLAPFEGPSITGFGYALALTASTLVVSAVNDNDIGTYVFNESTGGWNPTSELTTAAVPETYQSSGFGAAVALVGATIVVSRPLAVNVPTWFFLPIGTINSFAVGGVETQEDDQDYSGLFGAAVALSGSTLLAGAPAANEDAGAVFTYTRKGSALAPQTELTASDGQFGDGFGTALAFDGHTLVVGAPYANSGAGAVYLYSYSSGVWKPIAELTASDGQPGDLFGLSVALSSATVAIGAPGQNGSTGAVYLFGKMGAGWKAEAELTATGGQIEDGYGSSVGLAGANLLIGAPNADTFVSSYAGAAYLYTLSGGRWKPATMLIASDGQFGGQFGAAVALSGTGAAVGAPGDGSVPSVAYTFTQSAHGWLLNSELNDGWMQQDGFGGTLALSGSTLLVGAYGGNSLNGAAYLFTLKNGNWLLSSVLTAVDGQQEDDFGAAVALSGGSVAIGAPYASYGAGSFYAF